MSSREQLSIADLLPKDDAQPTIRDVDGFNLSKLTVPRLCVQPTADFIENVRRFGVLDRPLVVKRGDDYHVVSGKRRVLALRALEKETVNIRIMRLDELKAATLDVASNHLRASNPLADLGMILDLIKEGADESTISAATGMPVAMIRKRLALKRLSAKLLRAVADGKMAVSTAQKLAKLTTKEQERAETVLEKEGELSAHAVAGIRRAAKARSVKALPAALFAPEKSPSAYGAAWKSLAAAHLRDALAVLPATDGGAAPGVDVEGIRAALLESLRLLQ